MPSPEKFRETLAEFAVDEAFEGITKKTIHLEQNIAY